MRGLVRPERRRMRGEARVPAERMVRLAVMITGRGLVVSALLLSRPK